jgi:hypothetical protein
MYIYIYVYIYIYMYTPKRQLEIPISFTFILCVWRRMISNISCSSCNQGLRRGEESSLEASIFGSIGLSWYHIKPYIVYMYNIYIYALYNRYSYVRGNYLIMICPTRDWVGQIRQGCWVGGQLVLRRQDHSTVAMLAMLAMSLAAESHFNLFGSWDKSMQQIIWIYKLYIYNI